MKLRNLLITSIFLLFTFYLISCDTTDPGEPPEVRPSGYQEDIPWPSLADSPWPMANHDAQNTGRTKNTGPISSNQQVIFEQSTNMKGGGIVFADDSTFYYCSDSLRMFSVNGTVLMSSELEWGDKKTTPVIDNSGNIYFCNHRELYSFDNKGNMRWNYAPEEYKYINAASVTIDLDGNIYFFNFSNTIYSINQFGTLNWKLKDNRFNTNFGSSSLTFSPDGKTIYVPGFGVTLLAIDTELQSVKWTYGKGRLLTYAIADNEGNLYFSDNDTSFVSLDKNGNVRWENRIRREIFVESNGPALDWDGNSYFAIDTLYSFNYEGKLNWKLKLQGSCWAPIVIDGNNNIYVISEIPNSGGLGVISHIECFSQKGSLLWATSIENIYGIGKSPAISTFSDLFISLFENKIIKISE